MQAKVVASPMQPENHLAHLILHDAISSDPCLWQRNWMELCNPVSHACGNTLHLKSERERERQEKREHETVKTKKAPPPGGA